MCCGGELVQPGDTKEQVVDACGEPDYIDGNRWYYNTRTDQPRIVVFNAVGLVDTIEIVW
jgi:outer membrane protein assembly factor BamE (lipoprotein component of BamABCDE complex)